MFKFSSESASGLRKLGRDIYGVTHRNQSQHPQQQPQQQMSQPQTTQTTLPTSSSGNPTIINNIYNNMPPAQLIQVKKASLLKAIFYALLLTILILFLYYIFTNSGGFGLSHILQNGVDRVHEILTTIF